MSTVVANCPRCGSNAVTFDVVDTILVQVRYNWQGVFEIFSICRHCHHGTILVGHQENPRSEITEKEMLKQIGSLNDVMTIPSYISLKDEAAENAPEHVTGDVEAAFNEGAACMAIGCYNAAAAMFRLCLDMATRDRLPKEETEGLNAKVRRDLGLRLPWLFKNKLMPADLEELSHCIREDGNDGVHQGLLKSADAEDIADFTVELLTRLYTEPARLKNAAARREARRQKPK